MNQPPDAGIRPDALLIILSAIGLLDAGYLTFEHYRQLIPGCSILTGCEKVLTSSYSMIGSVPVALIGFFYYALLFIAAIIYHQDDRYQSLKFIFGLTSLGLLAAFWFTYLQLIVIRALCPYCLVSAVTSILLWLISLLALRRRRLSDA